MHEVRSLKRKLKRIKKVMTWLTIRENKRVNKNLKESCYTAMGWNWSISLRYVAYHYNHRNQLLLHLEHYLLFQFYLVWKSCTCNIYSLELEQVSHSVYIECTPQNNIGYSREFQVTVKFGIIFKFYILLVKCTVYPKIKIIITL